MKHLKTTKMLRKGRANSLRQAQEQAQFTLVKAMVLASTDLKQRSAIRSAASFLMDGHSVDLSQEFVDQKPSIARSEDWETSKGVSENRPSPGTIRVCWQCPEVSSALKSSRGSLPANLSLKPS